ncbi:hypothetical protein WME95_01230 [Sorangium sp. So ce327]
MSDRLFCHHLSGGKVAAAQVGTPFLIMMLPRQVAFWFGKVTVHG